MMLAAKQDAASKESPAQAAARGFFLALAADDLTRETMKAVLAQLGWKNGKYAEGGVGAAFDTIRNDGPPSLLLADLGDSGDPLDAADMLIAACGPGTRIIVLGLQNDVSLYRQLIDRGVADYLVKPVQHQSLLAAIQAGNRTERTGPAAAKPARVAAIVGARGGVGATAVAISVAWSMAKDKQQRVVLLDLDLHFGSLALSLDLEPGRGLREILTNPERVDSLLVRSAMAKASDGLRVLAAEEPLEDMYAADPAGLDALLADLGGNADWVVIDVPRALTALSRRALAVAETVGIVCEQTLPAMRDTQRLLTMVGAMRPDARAMVIANRVGGTAGEIGSADFERGIGGKIDFSISADIKAAFAAAERGKAMVEVTRDAKNLAEFKRLAIAMSGTGDARKVSIFKRLLGK
ncbi:MAG TPA: AAA family ATPase [Alphaproteobacteria bacterium]|jgi:pilus assembly protein CpaE|nr:AAA family ATPase [Alphaproteobacteria bacterium]